MLESVARILAGTVQLFRELWAASTRDDGHHNGCSRLRVGAHRVGYPDLDNSWQGDPS